MIVRCKECNTELCSHTVKTVCCGCSNMTTLRGDVISANDLNKVVIIQDIKKTKKPDLPQVDRVWQENRSKRKIRKLDFDVR